MSIIFIIFFPQKNNRCNKSFSETVIYNCILQHLPQCTFKCKQETKHILYKKDPSLISCKPIQPHSTPSHTLLVNLAKAIWKLSTHSDNNTVQRSVSSVRRHGGVKHIYAPPAASPHGKHPWERCLLRRDKERDERQRTWIREERRSWPEKAWVVGVVEYGEEAGNRCLGWLDMGGILIWV